MRNREPSKAKRKCFFCCNPVGDDHVQWTDQNAIRRYNKVNRAGKCGRPISDKESIFLCPGCSVQLGMRLMKDGMKNHRPSYRTALVLLKQHLEAQGTIGDEG